MIVAGIALPLIVAVTGMWDPHRWLGYAEQWRRVGPVSFYGRVVDTSGQPLSGVEVAAVVRTANWAFILGADRPGHDKPLVLTTDDHGRFEIVGERGYEVRIERISKSGYEFRHKINEGVYYFDATANPPHDPDPDNPVTFEMVPKGRK